MKTSACGTSYIWLGIQGTHRPEKNFTHCLFICLKQIPSLLEEMAGQPFPRTGLFSSLRNSLLLSVHASPPLHPKIQASCPPLSWELLATGIGSFRELLPVVMYPGTECCHHMPGRTKAPAFVDDNGMTCAVQLEVSDLKDPDSNAHSARKLAEYSWSCCS